MAMLAPARVCKALAESIGGEGRGGGACGVRTRSVAMPRSSAEAWCAPAAWRGEWSTVRGGGGLGVGVKTAGAAGASPSSASTGEAGVWVMVRLGVSLGVGV